MQKVIAIIKALLALIEAFLSATGKKQVTTDTQLDTIDAGIELAKTQGKDEETVEKAKQEVQELREKSPEQRNDGGEDARKVAADAAAKVPRNKKKMLSEFRRTKKK